jgi:hypothetical protein
VIARARPGPASGGTHLAAAAGPAARRHEMHPMSDAAQQPPRTTPPHHRGEVAQLFQDFLDCVQPRRVAGMREAPEAARNRLLEEASAALIRAADRAALRGLAGEIEALSGGTEVRTEAVRLLNLALRVARSAAVLRAQPVSGPVKDRAVYDAAFEEFHRTLSTLKRELAIWFRNPEEGFAELQEAMRWAAEKLTGRRLPGGAARPEAPVAPSPAPPGSAPGDAAESTPAAEGGRLVLADWAVASNGEGWHLYRKVNKRWRQRRAVAFAKGHQTKLIKLFADSGGTVDVNEALRKLWGPLPREAAQLGNLKTLLKSEMSTLGRAVRAAAGWPKRRLFAKDPHAPTYQAELLVGYASQIDSEREGGEAVWDIDAGDELPSERRIDLGL